MSRGFFDVFEAFSLTSSLNCCVQNVSCRFDDLDATVLCSVSQFALKVLLFVGTSVVISFLKTYPDNEYVRSTPKANYLPPLYAPA